MKKSISLIIALILIIACNTNSSKGQIIINESQLLHNLKVISHDSLEGRGFATEGNYKAQKYIAQQFQAMGIEPAFKTGYIQEFPYTFTGKRRQHMYPISNAAKDFSNVADTTVIGGNVLGLIKGKIDKAIVITGHLDHLGIKDGKIYNGADDDGSGTAALFTIADYFKDKSPKHTLIFAAVDAEEIGSLGCEYLLNNFPMAIEKVILNVNMDMIAHNDSLQLYASGLYHYPQLKQPLEDVKSKIDLLYGHDDPDNDVLDDWTFSSDHRIFHKRNIPFIYFGVEDHKDYHKATDTFENINTEFYIEAVKLIIQAIEGYDAFLTP